MVFHTRVDDKLRRPPRIEVDANGNLGFRQGKQTNRPMNTPSTTERDPAIDDRRELLRNMRPDTLERIEKAVLGLFSTRDFHEVSLQEVARIETEMKAIFEALGISDITSPTRRLAELAREERFLYPNDDSGRTAALAQYQRLLDEMNANLEPYFDLHPRAKLQVQRVPEFMEKTSALAYYQPGDLTGGRPGVFYANLRDMKEIYQFGMKTLSYHEGIPGHHFQIAIAMELKGVPFFRRVIPFTAYAEGWALYA